MVGRYLAQLLWFLGVYGAAVVAVPLTARWAARPVLALAVWLGVIVAVDLVRWQVAPLFGWVNMLLVWAWLHQLGYSLPALRARAPATLVTGGLVAFGLAVAVAALGPYSTSMVSTAADPRLSNLSPPTVVLALYGLAQVLLLAALWPALHRLMQWRPAWVGVAVFGSRAVDVYLWHIPLVGVVIATAWVTALGPAPLSAGWWALHVTVAALVVPLAWWLAGPTGRAAVASPGGRPRGRGRRHRRRCGVLAASLIVSVSIMGLSQTGLATWWGTGLLGLPMSTLVLVAALVGGWWVLVRSGSVPGVGADDARGLTGDDVADCHAGMPRSASRASAGGTSCWGTTTAMPTPTLNVRSSSSWMTPRSDSTLNTGGSTQVERSRTAPMPSGSTRATLAASPPPVMCDMACTSTASVRARQSRA